MIFGVLDPLKRKSSGPSVQLTITGHSHVIALETNKLPTLYICRFADLWFPSNCSVFLFPCHFNLCLFLRYFPLFTACCRGSSGCCRTSRCCCCCCLSLIWLTILSCDSCISFSWRWVVFQSFLTIIND